MMSFEGLGPRESERRRRGEEEGKRESWLRCGAFQRKSMKLNSDVLAVKRRISEEEEERGRENERGSVREEGERKTKWR